MLSGGTEYALARNGQPNPTPTPPPSSNAPPAPVLAAPANGAALVQPITLDLLGLQLELSRITLDLDAVPGAGNLVGNLLCAVAGLFDGLDLGAILSGVLGNILEALNGLL